MSAAIPLTEARDLRTGRVPWRESDWRSPPASPLPATDVDIAILGSGIMGSVLAERLARGGRTVALCDRRPPATGSTAASTAQIMWAMDVPLISLAREVGEEEAAIRWRRVFAAVERFGTHLDGLDASLKTDGPTVYLAGGLLDSSGLEAEAGLHRQHGLPSEFLPAAAVAERFGIAPRAGIVSTGTYAIDPVRTCHALLARAQAHGCTLSYPVDIVALHPSTRGVELETAEGHRFTAKDVILATGYERARLFLPPAFSLLSTYVIATRPGVAPLWAEDAMIWEANDPYLYVRSCSEGRIIAGGEDVDFSQAETRDDLLEAKAGKIAARLAATLGCEQIDWDCAWTATFGSSPDGLPAIGPVQSMEHVWIAAGFGGNGIAFAALAAELLETALAGNRDRDARCFDPYRFRD
ncbi:glycine/D-amino acid oxidase-like deaminating enzyme [Novosphingobium sp. PhB165]|uniref:NAD(P)/FAD-dependent oxidoreductase n=1 Tax=Novosphingobium sp. PhB165 TaxID=2485105 RepID=UPI001046ADE3|nr:FAD-dependent oxidoreductase [Novosphingobium sp. PhB165]TCM20361.1 glycine/D-amino acid oxidase-like deaminating enzyme [Novosphingobium sp. PhB165]